MLLRNLHARHCLADGSNELQCPQRKNVGSPVIRVLLYYCMYVSLLYLMKQIVQPIKKPVRTLSIFTSMAFVKDANGISFKNRLKGHINLRKVRNFIII